MAQNVIARVTPKEVFRSNRIVVSPSNLFHFISQSVLTS
jgi:hypothetical protein